ncbi:MAG TPA: translational machinery protein [Burkholderiales bacterium]|nr:translational machinery protein [Burkholderiales bacterium]
MSHYHAVVWLDHSDAHVFHFTREDVEKLTAHATHQHPHQHHKRGSIGSGRAPDDVKYFEHVADLLGGAQEILVTGPGSAKLELYKFLTRHRADMVPRVVGIETLDHPTDGQLLAHARQYFRAKDNMLP